VVPVASVAPLASAEQPDLTVFAAASLTNVFEDLQAPWSATYPGSELVLSFDASSALRAQIEEGAPADVFASADTRNAQTLVDECLAPGPITPFAGNTLVIVVPTGNPAGIESPADLAREGVRVVAAGPEVPITRYTTEAIANLGALEGYPAGFVEAVVSNTVSEEDNVRAVLTKIELGEGDAAIVYVTDAASSDQVETVAIPDEANVPATYAAVTVGASTQPALAASFLDFITGPEGQAVLAGYGFLTQAGGAGPSPAPTVR
jgi:molybdate transport system substrate-binding protein